MKPFSSLVTLTTNSMSSSHRFTAGTVLQKNGIALSGSHSQVTYMHGGIPVKVAFKEHERPVDEVAQVVEQL